MLSSPIIILLFALVIKLDAASINGQRSYNEDYERQNFNDKTVRFYGEDRVTVNEWNEAEFIEGFPQELVDIDAAPCKAHVNAVSLLTYTDNTYIGGTGGLLTVFSVDGERTRRISRIKMWYNTQKVKMRGMQIDFVDSGDEDYTRPITKMYGNTNDAVEGEFIFQYGETITKFQIWDNKHCNGAGRVAKVKFTTNQGRTFELGKAVGDPYEPPVGSGVPAGVLIRSGADIDALGILFFV